MTTQNAPAPAPPVGSTPLFDRGVAAGRISAAVVIALIVVASLTTEGFATWANAKAIVASVAIIGPVAIAATIIMISGNLFSLSLGVTAATSGMLFLSLLDHGLVVAVLGTLAAGSLVFALQGAVVGAWGVNPIIVTIGAGSLQAAVATKLTGGTRILPPTGHTDYELLSRNVLGIPIGVYVFAIIALVVHWLLARSSLGRRIHLVGENRQAAYVAGIPVAAAISCAFALAGACVAVAGLIQAASVTSANLASEGTLTFDATAAAVVGGNAIAGGRGSVARTVAGVMVIATIGDLLLIRGYSTGAQLAIKGLLVVAFVFISSRRERSR